MFAEYDSFRLLKPLPDGDLIATGTRGVVLLVLGGNPCGYEVEFPDGKGGNLGHCTYTVTEDFMLPMDGFSE